MKPIYKYHGTGNDFALLAASDFGGDVRPFVSAICDRHRGVGADGVIVIDRDVEGCDARMIIYNRDGSRPQMCGNGVRCVARYLVEQHGLANELTVLSDAGLRACVVSREGDAWSVDVDMGEATIGPPVEWSSADGSWQFVTVDMGNPHAVVFDAPRTEVVDRVGASLNGPGSPFANGVNVEFTTVEGDNELRVVVYERGVGRTQACGTGACAVAVAAWHNGLSDGVVTVHLPGGPLQIRESDGHVWMRGDAEFVMEVTLAAGWLRARTTG